MVSAVDSTEQNNNTPHRDERGKSGFAARKASVDILGKVVRKRRPLDQELNPSSGHAEFRMLAGNDRALVRAIVGACLRHRGEISMVLDRLLDRRIPEKSGRVLDILHVAIAQMLYLKVPDRAAVSLAVDHAAFDRRAKPYKGLVNGVLRRLGREREVILANLGDARVNTPDWLFDGWSRAYGQDAALALAAAHLEEAPLDLTVKSDPGMWAEKLDGCVVGAGSVRLHKKQLVETLEGFDQGEWWVQDLAASLPVRMLGDVSGKSVADLCAAPGGKTAQLAAGGAQVVAVDISQSRLKRVSENLARLKLSADIVTADLREWEPSGQFDAILLDAPCSATGTIRRHSDVPWLKQLYDVEVLSKVQADLLRRSVRWLKPGGVLVYCTCSLERAEGEDQISTFLAETEIMSLDPLHAREIGGLSTAVTEEGYLRTLPFHPALPDGSLTGMDGFFAARLRRV